MLIWLEIKKYLLDYRRILFGAAVAVLTGGLLFWGVNALLARENLFEPFAVGVVDNDNSMEIKLVFDFFSEAIQLDYMDKSAAEGKLSAGEIPAYVELPERFASDIMSGENSPFKLYGNRDMPLQWSLSKLLASGAVAFLSSAQAGIYATLDYAAERGMPYSEINRNILYPINIAFVKKLLDYESFFEPRVLPLTGHKPAGAHYVYTFAAFLFMVNLLSFVRTIKAYPPALYARFKLAGISSVRLQGVRLTGLFVMNLLLTAPLYILAAYWVEGAVSLPVVACGLALSLCVSAFGLMAASLCKSEAACGLFIFLTALAMLFFSGGLLPLAYLPREIHPLRYVSVNFWAAEGTVIGAGALLAFALSFFGVVCGAELLPSHVSRAA